MEEKIDDQIIVQTILYTMLEKLGNNPQAMPLMEEIKLRLELSHTTSLDYTKSLFTRLSTEDRINVFQAIKTPTIKTILNSTFR